MSSRVRHRLVRRGPLSAVIGVLLSVMVAAPVFAFTSRRTHIVTVPVSGGYKLPPGRSYGTAYAFGSSTATCPSGQHALFGGFDGGFFGGQGMHRTANNRWTVEAFNISAPPFGTFRVSLASFVYCGNGPVATKATSTVEIRYRSPSRYSGSATARCPAGTVVVAGGFAISPNTHITVTALERVAADLWRVSASLFDSPHTALTSIAYCGPGPAPKLISQTFDGGPATVRATCPVGTKLAFGGAIVTQQESEYSFLQTLRAETRSTWSVGGRGDTLTALAYCR